MVTSEEEAIELRPIGRVSSPLTDAASAPRQGDEGAPEAWLVFEPEFADGMRSLVPVEGTRLRVSDLEAIDGTPVVDLKPVLGSVEER